jgi:hypothetical protein
MMPNPNEKSVNPLLQENVNFLRKFSGGDDRTELTNEVKSLRAEVRQLIEILKPVESLVATGQQVLEEYKRLRGRQ